MTHRNAVKSDRRRSIITTINAGFGALNRHLWIMALPVVLDLFFWLGPRISPQPLAGRLLRSLPVLAVQLEPLMGQRQAAGIAWDLRIHGVVLNWLQPLVGSVTIAQSPLALAPWHIGSLGLLLGTLVLGNVIGLLITAVYLLLLGDAVQARGSAGRLLRTLRSFGAMAGVVVIWSGIVLLLLVPFLVVGALVAVASQALGVVIMLVGLMIVLWMAFTSQFAFAAVVLNDAKPARALLGSVIVVRYAFWSALGLFALSSFIVLGLQVVWQALAQWHAVGVVAAIIGNAYVVVGLAAAHLVWYRDRIAPAPVQQPE